MTKVMAAFSDFARALESIRLEKATQTPLTSPHTKPNNGRDIENHLSSSGQNNTQPRQSHAPILPKPSQRLIPLQTKVLQQHSNDSQKYQQQTGLQPKISNHSMTAPPKPAKPVFKEIS
jgi:hypothetical protein